ncbi:MAG: site-specific DNA-methyltransferase [Chrysiogenetes bacterium]|nr:site-specific DNA-methyltransferase [Chrysiogenetes bacterium]
MSDYRVIHGDCLAVLPTLAADLVVTSPPYNCGKHYGTADDSLAMRDYWEFTEAWFSAAARICSGYICANVPNWIGSRSERVFALDEYRAIFDRHAEFIDIAIWHKGPANGAAWGNRPNAPRLRANHEWVLIYRCGDGMADNGLTWGDWSRLTETIWKIPATLPFRNDHPATFPVALPERCIRLYSQPGAVVLDPFCGTGTTGEAAVGVGRDFIGIEIDAQHAHTAQKRLDCFTAQADLFAGISL